MEHVLALICPTILAKTRFLLLLQPKLMVNLEYGVKDWMTNLIANYERLNAKTTKLHLLEMKISSQINDTCAHSYLHHYLGKKLVSSYSNLKSHCRGPLQQKS